MSRITFKTPAIDPAYFQRWIMDAPKGSRVVYWNGFLAYDAAWGFQVDKVAARSVKSLAWLGYRGDKLNLFQKRQPDGTMDYIAEHR